MHACRCSSTRGRRTRSTPPRRGSERSCTGVQVAEKTASFFDYTGPGRVSIARFPPRGTPAGFRVFRALAPGPWSNAVDEPEYRRRYAAQLAALDPQTTLDALADLAGIAEPVLLCWERKADLVAGRAFCHRRIVAEWFRDTLGATVDER